MLNEHAHIKIRYNHGNPIAHICFSYGHAAISMHLQTNLCKGLAGAGVSSLLFEIATLAGN